MLVCDGLSGFPLAAWLRPGTVHARCGAVAVLKPLVAALRAVWPGVRIVLRGDNGLAVPEVYDYGAAAGLDYLLGYASNAVLQRRTDAVLGDLELYYQFHGHREPQVQRFEDIDAYQAGSWPHPRRVVAKVAITPQGSQRRFVVSNCTGSPEAL